MTDLKLGRLPSKYDGRDLQFGEYLFTRKEVYVPPVFGHGNTFKDWGMLGNDQYGDCVWAGFDHEVMNYANLAAGGVTGQEVVKFSTANTLSDYGSTGFNPETGENDNGTEVRSALGYRQTTGLVDETGKRHKIGAYVSIDPKNHKHIITALWIFEAVGLGFAVPESAMTQFNEGKPWDVSTRETKIIGGHYVPLIGKPVPTGEFAVITWAQRQLMTEKFFNNYVEECWAYITPEELQKRSQANWGGFNWRQLEEDLKVVTN